MDGAAPLEGPDGKEAPNFIPGVSLDSSPLLQGVIHGAFSDLNKGLAETNFSPSSATKNSNLKMLVVFFFPEECKTGFSGKQ